MVIKFLPVQRLQMSDDFFGKLLLSEGFFQHPRFFLEIPPHDFEANQAPENQIHKCRVYLTLHILMS